MSDETPIKITLRPLPDEVPAVNRLRSALKTLLRVYKLRCLRVEDAPPATEGSETQEEQRRPASE